VAVNEPIQAFDIDDEEVVEGMSVENPDLGADIDDANRDLDEGSLDVDIDDWHAVGPGRSRKGWLTSQLTCSQEAFI